MIVIYESPILVSETKSGKNKYWQVLIYENPLKVNGYKYFTATRYWQDVIKGTPKIQESEPVIAWPTNVGQSNERNNYAQAGFEAAAMLEKQIKKGYHEKDKPSSILPLPMLANKWNDKKHLITYPVYIQPKFDGCRMIMEDGRCWSRTGKEFPKEIVEHLIFNTNRLTLDGELILSGGNFQDTMRAVKKFRPETTPKLEYHIFDIIEENIPFKDRLEDLLYFDKLDIGWPDRVYIVTTTLVNNEIELLQQHSQNIINGYEGTIIRDMNAKYEIGHRSNYLLKMKDFDDAEFTIVNILEGEGSDAGAAICECVTDTGITFRVRPKGTIEYRRHLYANKGYYIGLPLTVKFQGRTDDDIPRFPIGTGIRDTNF